MPLNCSDAAEDAVFFERRDSSSEEVCNPHASAQVRTGEECGRVPKYVSLNSD